MDFQPKIFFEALTSRALFQGVQVTIALTAVATSPSPRTASPACLRIIHGGPDSTPP